MYPPHDKGNPIKIALVSRPSIYGADVSPGFPLNEKSMTHRLKTHKQI
jgi:hypothetical protein